MAGFWVSDCCLLIVSSRDRKWVRESSWGASYKGTDPIYEAPPTGPNHLSKASPPNIITLEVRISTLGGGLDIQFVTDFQSSGSKATTQELWGIVLLLGRRNRAVSLVAGSVTWIPTPGPVWLPWFVRVPPTNSFSVSLTKCWFLLFATKNN